MREEKLETQMLALESMATGIINILDNERHDDNLLKFTYMRILKMYYDTDRDKYDTIVKIIQERRNNDRGNRE